MERPVKKMKTVDSCKKITIKVKIGGEDYHDVTIEYLNDDEAHEQLFGKLSSITGIPLERILNIRMYSYENDEIVDTYFNLWSTIIPINYDPELFEDEYISTKFSEIVGEGHLVDGEHYALSMDVRHESFESYVHFELVERYLYDEKECLPAFCQHINSRAFIDRRIQILNSSLGKSLAEAYERYYDFEDYLRVYPALLYVHPVCKIWLNGFIASHTNLYYPRTRG